jgi:hypothetical protein
MTASMVHVTNLTPPGSDNPAVQTPVDDSQYGPCHQSDTRVWRRPWLQEGAVFEINNGVPHRVSNDADTWRIHLLLAGLSLHSRVSDWAHGPYRLSSTDPCFDARQ